MAFLEDTAQKTKEFIDVARQRTTEVIAVERQRIAMASLKSKREKEYAKLGRIYFKMIKDEDMLDTDTRNLIESIVEKNSEIARIKEEIDSIKNN